MPSELECLESEEHAELLISRELEHSELEESEKPLQEEEQLISEDKHTFLESENLELTELEDSQSREDSEP